MSDNFILGENYEVTDDTTITQLNNNIVVVGPSGCGKTMSYAEMRLLKTESSSMIVMLSKRKLVHKYTGYLSQKGYTVLDLDLTHPMNNSVCYDPLRYAKTTADITYIAQAIVMSNPQKMTNKEADPFWDDAAQSLLSALIAYSMHIKTFPSFADVVNLITRLQIKECGDAIETNLDNSFGRLGESQLEVFAKQCWKTFRYAPLRTASCIYASLNATIDTIFTPELLCSMGTAECINLQQLANEKTVLFVTTSAVNPSLNAFAALFFSHIVKELFEYAESIENSVLPIPIHLLCDDFAAGARIPNFDHYISIFREKGISTSILLQSESQLIAMYGDAAATTIINNCDRYLYMGGMDLATCKNIAERINCPLSDILYLPLKQEYIFERGRMPVRTERWHITDDPTWKSLQ